VGFVLGALLILVGCLLETYGGLRPVSDAGRSVLYRKGYYENDLRDLLQHDGDIEVAEPEGRHRLVRLPLG